MRVPENGLPDQASLLAPQLKNNPLSFIEHRRRLRGLNWPGLLGRLHLRSSEQPLKEAHWTVSPETNEEGCPAELVSTLTDAEPV
jgi:hypothetical protein